MRKRRRMQNTTHHSSATPYTTWSVCMTHTWSGERDSWGKYLGGGGGGMVFY